MIRLSNYQAQYNSCQQIKSNIDNQVIDKPKFIRNITTTKDKRVVRVKHLKSNNFIVGQQGKEKY